MVNLFDKTGCEGCENRAAIMGAGTWQQDATVFLVLLFLTGVIIYLSPRR